MSGGFYLFISPHLDDVVLSCGGLIHRLTSSGQQVLVFTVITADTPPDFPLSWLSRRNHMAWNLGDAPFATRRLEDQAALQCLGAQYKHLGLHDAMYRRDAAGAPLYNSAIVDIPVHPDDWHRFLPVVCQTLQNAMPTGDNQPILVFCPMTAGNHIDHIIVRQTIESLWPLHTIAYYEDYPYAARPGIIRQVLTSNGRTNGWISETVELTNVEVEARISAVACYVSQLPGLFPTKLMRTQEIARARLPVVGKYLTGQPNPVTSRSRMSSALKAYIAGVGGERYWFRDAESAARVEDFMGGGTA
jgi:LmbE family N-acetylglucosaminyl deacetylase